jgi:hypothetical protein
MHICRARQMTDEQRSSIANYFGLYKGQEKGISKVALGMEDHPSVGKAYEVLQEAFVEVRLQPTSVLCCWSNSEHPLATGGLRLMSFRTSGICAAGHPASAAAAGR